AWPAVTAKKLSRSVPVDVLIGLVVLWILAGHMRGGPEQHRLKLDTFEGKVATHQVRTAEFNDRDLTVKGELRDGTKYRVNYLKEDGPNVVNKLRQAGGIAIKVNHQKDPVWWALVQSLLPILILVGVFLFFMNAVQGGGSGVRQ